MNLRPDKLLATSFGIGYLPLAPGSWASLAAVLLWALLHETINFTLGVQLVFILAVLIAGLWSSIRLEKDWGKDPSQIVIDEWAGMWITCFALPVTWINLLLAFIVFRVLDIWKPLFIRRAEKLRGGWGVMMDDILAGIVGNIFVLILIWILNR